MPRCLALAILLVATSAHAVIVRGRVTSQLGKPLPGSRVQLISLAGGPRNAADTISGVDGSYELRTDLAGRFLLLTSPSMNTAGFAPQIGNPFYGGRMDVLTINVALDGSAITPQVSSQPTLVETPLGQLADVPAQIAGDELLTHTDVIPALRSIPGVFLVQFGQAGTAAQLHVRGVPVERVLVDGVSAEQLGGGVNLSAFTTDGLAAISSMPAVEAGGGANPLHGVDAEGGTLSLATAQGATVHPVLIYSGDAGTLSSLRNEAIATLAYGRFDGLVSFARFNTDNDFPAERVHFVTSAANLGYRISGNTSLRLTLRDDVSGAPMASPYAFYGVAPSTKLAAQDLVGGFTFETRTAGNWHNLLRYGVARERSSAFQFGAPATGLPVTIVGANGYQASGTASFLPVPAREDTVTNRDEGTWQTDYPLAKFLTALLTIRYQDERGADLPTAFSYGKVRLERTHWSYAGAFQGEIRHRLFFAASGLIDSASIYGVHGAPSLGLTYAPVRPGTRRFRGTSLRLTLATGFGEPSVLEQALVANAVFSRSRTFEAGVDQTILARKLLLRTTYFHNQMSRQRETIGLAPLALGDGLAYRTQGLTSELRYQPAARLLLDGGCTYLASLVELSGATAMSNPGFPGIAIGATTALVGSRPFYRPPGTGFVTAQITETRYSASLKATFASRSDGSTGLVLNPGLLLPNRNVSPGYTALDANFTANVTHSAMLYAEFENLLDNRNIAPIGYLGTPFRVRVGLRLRFGRE
jgi:iron complex outermembrane receptor protein/vitamin B12 transporter